MKNVSMRTKIVVPTILLFVFSLGTSAWLTYRVSRDAMEQAAQAHVSQIADATAKAVSIWVVERPREINAWSERSEICTIVSAADAAAPAAISAATSMLQRFNKEAPWYEILVLADRKGVAICSSTPQASKDITVADRDYFQRAMAGQVVVSDVIKSKTSGNPVVVVAVPVRSGDQCVGVLLGALDLKVFTRQFVDPLKIGSSGYVFVADRRGVICSHPDASLVMATNLASLAFGPEILKNKNGSMRYVYKGDDVLAAYRTDLVSGWIVVARVPAREVMTSTRTIRNLNLLLGLVAILLTTLVLLMLSKSITRTITDLAGVAGLITRGRLSEARTAVAQINKIRRPSRDEAGALWNSMSAMADSLNSLVGQVQQSSVQLVSTATEIETAAREQESVIANFGASTTQVVASARQISATSQELSKTMETVKTVAEGTVTLADDGRAGLTGMEGSIRQLVKAAASVSAKLAVINVKAVTIGGVVTTITKVADQNKPAVSQRRY
jgi:methyl-accepting chemotaxis protein